MGILLVYDVTDERSFNSKSFCHNNFFCSPYFAWIDIRTWHNNIEQHASDGVNKILIGNKSDWTDKRAVTTEQGQELAHELGIKFMETSAKVNEGVEEAFFTLARSAGTSTLTFFSFPLINHYRDIKTRLIDSQAENTASGAPPSDSVKVNQPAAQSTPGCCS